MFDFCNSLGVVLGTLLTGYWIQSSGYEGPFWFLLVLETIACVICLFIQEPISSDIKNVSNLSVRSKLSDIFHFTWCTSELTMVLGSYFMALNMFMFVYGGQLRVMTLFLETSPLCFDNITIGWWIFLQGIVMTI